MRIRNNNTQTKFKPFVNYGYNSTVHKIRENQLKINQKLLLALNKNIQNSPYEKINDNMSQASNSSISYNFSVNNSSTTTFLNKNFNFYNSFLYTLKGGNGLLFSTQNSLNIETKAYSSGNVSPNLVAKKGQNLGIVETKRFIGQTNTNRMPVLNFVLKVINSFFNTIGCICSKPQFIQHHDRLIIRIFYYELSKTHLKNLFSLNLLNIQNSATATSAAHKISSLYKNSSSSEPCGLLNTNFYNSLYNSINKKNKTNYVLNIGFKKVLQSLFTQKILNYFKKNTNKVNSLKVVASTKNLINSLNNQSLLSTYLKNFKLLGILLSKIFSTNIEVQAVRLHNIGLEKNILANIISKNSNSMRLNKIQKTL